MNDKCGTCMWVKFMSDGTFYCSFWHKKVEEYKEGCSVYE